MALQLSVAVRNALLDAIESTAGTAVKVQIRTGAVPATPATADAGTLLVEIDAPSDWLADAASGVKAKAGTWSAAAAATGTAAHFRVKDTAGTTCHLQGTVTVTGGGGDLTLDNVSIASGQTVTISTFSLTAPNA